MQNSESDCGIATIRTILKQLKYRFEESEIYKNYHIDKTQGLSLAQLKDILDGYGINANAYGVSDFSELKKLTQFPVVLVVENDGLAHYILVHEIKGTEFIISDPAEPEIRTYDEAYIESIFIGYALCLEGQQVIVESKTTKRNVEQEESIGNVLYKEIMNSITFGEKLKMICLMVMKYILPLGITLIMQTAMENGFNNGWLGIALPVIISLVSIFAFYLVNRAESLKKTQIENMIQEKVLMKYYHQKMKDFYSGKNIENISGYFWNLFYSVSGLLEKFYLNLNLVYLAILMIFLGIVSPGLMFIIFFWGIIFIAYLDKQVMEVRNNEKDIIGKSSGFFQTVEDNIRHSFDVNLLAKKIEAGQFVEEKMKDYFISKFRSVKNASKITSTYELFNVMILISAFVFLSLSKSSGGLLNNYNSILIISMILSSVSPVIQNWLNYETSKVSIDHIQSSSDYQEKVEIEEKETLPIETIKSIRFDRVSFNYSDKRVFEKLDFELKAGKVYGISGENGAGKSTLVKLLAGILEPSEGTIYLNDSISKKSLKETNMHEFISMYSSESGLYKNSVTRNIRFKVFNEELSTVEKRTYNDLFGMGLPGGYLVQSDGVNLSQGQKQKLLLMRTLEQDKSIYIFDEPTGNLDFNSKQALKEEINKLADKGKMVILISHEQEIVDIADEIIKLEGEN